MAVPSSFSSMVLARKAQLWAKADAAHPPSYCESQRLTGRDSDALWHCCTHWQRKLSNKLNAKVFAARLGICVPQLYWEGFDPAKIPFATLPSNFVVKTSNGAASEEVVPVRNHWDVLRNQTADPSHVRLFFEKLLSSARYRGTSLLVEEFVEPSDGELLPRDYKVYCFAGQPHYIEVIDRTGRRDAWYSIDWKRVADRMQLCFDPDRSIERPVLLDQLLLAARRLSDAYEYPFVRIDFYLTSSKVIFGEFTHTPFAGKSAHLFTAFAEDKLGSLWRDALTMRIGPMEP